MNKKIEIVISVYDFHKSEDYFIKPFKRMIKSLDLNKFEICISDTGKESSKPIFDSILSDYRYYYERGTDSWMNISRTKNNGVNKLTENKFFVVSDADIIFPTDFYEGIQEHLNGICRTADTVGCDYSGHFDVIKPLIASPQHSYNTEAPGVLSAIKKFPTLNIVRDSNIESRMEEEIKFSKIKFKNSDVKSYNHSKGGDHPPNALYHISVLFDKYVSRWNGGVGGCFIIKRNSWDSCGGFNEDILVTEDIDLWNRLKAVRNSQHMHECGCTTVLHSDLKKEICFRDKEFKEYYFSVIRTDLNDCGGRL